MFLFSFICAHFEHDYEKKCDNVLKIYKFCIYNVQALFHEHCRNDPSFLFFEKIVAHRNSIWTSDNQSADQSESKSQQYFSVVLSTGKNNRFQDDCHEDQYDFVTQISFEKFYHIRCGCTWNQHYLLHFYGYVKSHVSDSSEFLKLILIGRKKINWMT